MLDMLFDKNLKKNELFIHIVKKNSIFKYK